MEKFKCLENYTPYELEFVLFGLTYQKQEKLSKKQKEELHETYGNLFCVRFKHLEVKVFVEKVKALIKNIKKILLEEVKRSA